MADSKTKSGADVQAEVAHAVDHLDYPASLEPRWGTMQPDEMGGTKFVPVAKQALRVKSLGRKPPFDVRMPDGSVMHVIEEGRADASGAVAFDALSVLSAR